MAGAVLRSAALGDGPEGVGAGQIGTVRRTCDPRRRAPSARVSDTRGVLSGMAQMPLADTYAGHAPRVTFRVPPGVIAGVDEVAARRGVKRSELVRLALVELLDREAALPA